MSIIGNSGLRPHPALGQILADLMAAPAPPAGMFGKRPLPATPGYGDGLPTLPLGEALDAAKEAGEVPLNAGAALPRQREHPGVPRQESTGRGAMLMEPLAALAAPVLPTVTAPKPKFFGEGGDGRFAIGILGDILAGATGGQPLFAQAQMQKRREEAQLQAREAEWGRQDRTRAQDRAWAVEDRDYAATRPETFTSGRDRVRYDPATGQSAIVYDGQEDFETYAGSMGDPDSPEYRAAMQDYVLRGNGPTAFKYDQGLEAVRNANRVALRSTPTYAQANPRPRAGGGGGGGGRGPSIAATVAPLIAKVARGEKLTPAENEAWGMYRGGRTRNGAAGGGGASGVPQVRSAADYNKLAPGAQYRDPSGNLKVKR